MVLNCTFDQSLNMKIITDHINRLKKRGRTISANSHEYDFMTLWGHGLSKCLNNSVCRPSGQVRIIINVDKLRSQSWTVT
jgi:hypothetical protein